MDERLPGWKELRKRLNRWEWGSAAPPPSLAPQAKSELTSVRCLLAHLPRLCGLLRELSFRTLCRGLTRELVAKV